MLTAKIFENGRSQAVRLPKEYRFDCNEVMVNKIGDIVVLMPKNNKWNGVLLSGSFSEDFFKDGRKQPELEKREEIE